MKKTLVTLLAFLSIVTLSACDKDNSSSNTQSKISQSTDHIETTNTYCNSSTQTDSTGSQSYTGSGQNNKQQSAKQDTSAKQPATKQQDASKSSNTDAYSVQQKINEENIRHEKKIAELQNNKQSTGQYYDNLIEKRGGISLLNAKIDEARKSELSQIIFNLEMSIKELERDTSQRALQRKSEQQKKLDAAQAEWSKIVEQSTLKNEIARLNKDKNTKVAEIDKQIKEENNLHSENLKKLNG